MPKDQTGTTLEDRLTALENRLAELEAKPVNALTAEQISEALDAHPDMGRFRAFLDKWGNRPA